MAYLEAAFTTTSLLRSFWTRDVGSFTRRHSTCSDKAWGSVPMAGLCKPGLSARADPSPSRRESVCVCRAVSVTHAHPSTSPDVAVPEHVARFAYKLHVVTRTSAHVTVPHRSRWTASSPTCCAVGVFRDPAGFLRRQSEGGVVALSHLFFAVLWSGLAYAAHVTASCVARALQQGAAPRPIQADLALGRIPHDALASSHRLLTARAHSSP